MNRGASIAARVAPLASAVAVFVFGYAHVYPRAEYRVVPAVVYVLSGMLFAAGTRPLGRKPT